MILLRRAFSLQAFFLVLLRPRYVLTKEDIEMAWPTDFTVNLETTLATAEKQGLSPSQADQYRKYMKGCYDAFSREECDRSEKGRIEMNAKQPPLQHNLTETGYARHKASVSVFNEITRLLAQREGSSPQEHWHGANIHTNHWEVPTRKWDIPVTNAILHPVQTVLEQWCGAKLVPVAVDGVRTYQSGSIVAPHLERMPLVISAVINVAQAVDEDWIFQLLPHSGVPVSIVMQPGDMIVYESHSVAHGWPCPLKGESYATLFLHFEPTGHSSQHFRSQTKNKEALWDAALKQNIGMPKPKPVKRLPSYIEPDSLEASRWFQEFVFERVTWNKPPELKPNKVTSMSKDKPPDAHRMASRGDLNSLKIVAQQKPDSMTHVDDNGWAPIHEAARSGQTEVIEFLLDRYNVDINQRTGKKQRGGSALWWAEKNMPDNMNAIKFMKERGAKSIPPDD